MLILSLKNALIYVTEIQHSTENLAIWILPPSLKNNSQPCLNKKLLEWGVLKR